MNTIEKQAIMNQYIYYLTISQNENNQNVDQIMRNLLIPRKWRHFLRIEKNILVNDKYLPLNFKVHTNDLITIKLNHVESLQQQYPASGNMPNIIYENADVLVINKPAGQKTHPNLYETDTALNDCTSYLGYSPYIVHRLDMLTNGLLLVAKNPAVVPILNKQLIDKTLSRSYFAWIDATNDISDNGTINLPIGDDPLDIRKRMVRTDGLKAITHYQVVKKTANKILVKLQLETGRTHQIRVHLAAIGHPIIGDPLYNSNYQAGEKLQLTAYKLVFQKPFSFDKEEVLLDKKI